MAQMMTNSAPDINSIMSGWVDRGAYWYWDTLVLAAGTALASQYILFVTPQGQSDPYQTGVTKSIWNTNMRTSASFAPPRCLILQAIGLYFGSAIIKADIDAILNDCWMDFTIDEKIFFSGWITDFPSGGGLAGVTTQSGQAAYTNGLPAPQYTRRYGDYSKYIAPLMQFKATLNFPGTAPTLATTGAGGVGLILREILDGLTDRSVQ